MSTSNPPKPKGDATQQSKLQIQVDDPIAQGVYVNLTLVNHTETEFVFDFIFVQPLEPRAKVRSRIISSPKHAKRFLLALSDNVAKYEARFGDIDVSAPPQGVH